MARTGTARGNGHSRQRSASTKAKQTSQRKPRRGGNSRGSTQSDEEAATQKKTTASKGSASSRSGTSKSKTTSSNGNGKSTTSRSTNGKSSTSPRSTNGKGSASSHSTNGKSSTSSRNASGKNSASSRSTNGKSSASTRSTNGKSSASSRSTNGKSSASSRSANGKSSGTTSKSANTAATRNDKASSKKTSARSANGNGGRRTHKTSEELKPTPNAHGAASKPKSAVEATKDQPVGTKPKAARASTEKAAGKGSAKSKSAAGGSAKQGKRGGAKSGGGGGKPNLDISDKLPDLKPKSIAGKFAMMALKRMAKKAKKATVGKIQSAADRAASATPGDGPSGGGVVGKAAETLSNHGVHPVAEKLAQKRLPVQRSVDIAVPLRVAWEEWQTLDFIPEGTHCVHDIERDGDELTGSIDGVRDRQWAAEILDERPEQSFAWQSHEGSDCAGLITFHRISDRLTRLELNLDVVPTTVPEAVKLTAHIADRRAEAELRRFKARLELINPDLYEEDEEDEEDAAAQDEEAAEQDPEEEEDGE